MLLTGRSEKSGEDWLVEQARPAGAAPARCAGAGTPVCDVNPVCCTPSAAPSSTPAPRRPTRRRSTAGFGTAGAGPDFCGKTTGTGIRRRKRWKRLKKGKSAGDSHSGKWRDTGACWERKSELGQRNLIPLCFELRSVQV